MELTTLISGGHFYECPRWHEDRWWISDFYAHTVSSIGPDGSTRTEAEVPGQPSGLGWLPGGDLLIVSMTDHKLLRRGPDGTLTEYADLTGFSADNLNDMTVHNGHAYVGCFGFDLMSGAQPVSTNVIHVAPDGRVEIAADGLWFPNAMVVIDGELVVAETLGARFTAFTIAADGTLHDRRVWAQVEPSTPGDLTTMLAGATFAPDGCAADAEGHVWAANAIGGVLCRVAPGGEIVERIPMPGGLGVYACGLGGPDGHTLVACAAPDFYAHNRAVVREAILFSTTVEVPAPGMA